jgi:predicted nuclease with TOPRIM domain
VPEPRRSLARMSDSSIRERISDLVQEEHTLRDKLSSHEISPAEEQTRLRQLEIELDQCWDLLRQRQAKREFGQNADTAQVRDARTVEGYQG